MRRKVFSNEHPMTLTAMISVARVSLQLGKVMDALALAEDAAAMSDRVYASAANARHASAFATLAEARFASGNPAGAAQAMQRAEDLLAMLGEPVPSTAAYLDKVRAQVCAPAPTRQNPATSAARAGKRVSAGCVARG